MKCAYKAVLNQQRAERDEKLIEIQEHRARADFFALALFTAQEQFKFDAEQCKKMMDGMFEEASEAFDTYKDETQTDYDPTTVPFLLQGFLNQLDALEVDVREIETKYAFKPVGEEKQAFWSKERINKLKGRLEILADREVSYRAYMYAFMLYLYHEYGYEGKKLADFYDGVRLMYHSLWSKYLECNEVFDTMLANTIDRHIYEIHRQGIDITGMTDVTKGKNDENVADTDAQSAAEQKTDNEKGEENG